MKTKLLNLFSLIFIGLFILILTSCTVLRTHSTKTQDVYGLGAIQLPVIVDLDVKETKVTGTSTTSVKGEPISVTKNNAVYDALKSVNADVLIEPRFDTETIGDKTKVTVTGFPATYKNFKPITESDVTLIKVIDKGNEEKPSGFTKGALPVGTVKRSK